MARKRKERDRKESAPLADDVTAASPSTSPAAPNKRISPLEIQQKEFRLSAPIFGRGYNEHDVDSFLDEVTEEVARLHADNRRLREQMESRGTVPMDPGAAAEADDVIRRARQEAARIVSEAEAEANQISSAAAPAAATAGPTATAGGGVGSRIPLTAFLAREREFLQSMAGLIQSHADSVKSDVRKARETIAQQSPSGTSAPAGPSREAPPSVEGNPAPRTNEATKEGTTEGSAESTAAAPQDAAERSEPPGPAEASRALAEEPWQAPVSLQAPSPPFDRPGPEEGQGPAGDDEGSPWRSSPGLIVTGAGATGGRRKPSADRSFDRGSHIPHVDAGDDPDRLLDLTGGEPRMTTSDAEEADLAYGLPVEEADIEEPSLRELFWGQE
jgi:DivIVA domain-containing protein